MEVFEHYRRLLFSIAYRMLGSVAEAEDILQDAYVRFQSVSLAEVESPKSYLAAIVTRLCLNQLTSARAQRETYLGPWLPEPVLTATHPELVNPETQASHADSISMAFLTLLQNLTPAERAVFLLHEVFDYDYSEIAHILDKSEAACRKLGSRAKGYITANRPRFHTTPDEHRRLLEAFMRAAGEGDVAGLMALLAEDVTFWADGGGKVKGAALEPVHGPLNVARFIIGVTARFMPVGATFAVTEVNGKPTLLIRRANGMPALVVSVEVGEAQVHTIWVIANPDKLGAVA